MSKLTTRAALETVLDCIDYTRGACTPMEPVAAVLPKEVIQTAREAIAAEHDYRRENDELRAALSAARAELETLRGKA